MLNDLQEFGHFLLFFVIFLFAISSIGVYILYIIFCNKKNIPWNKEFDEEIENIEKNITEQSDFLIPPWRE